MEATKQNVLNYLEAEGFANDGGFSESIPRNALKAIDLGLVGKGKECESLLRLLRNKDLADCVRAALMLCGISYRINANHELETVS